VTTKWPNAVKTAFSAHPKMSFSDLLRRAPHGLLRKKFRRYVSSVVHYNLTFQGVSRFPLFVLAKGALFSVVFPF
jgi:hypothetical protein